MVQGPALPDGHERVGTREDLQFASIVRVWWYYRSCIVLTSTFITILATVILAAQEQVYVAKALIKIDNVYGHIAKDRPKSSKRKEASSDIENSVVYMTSNSFLKVIARKAKIYSDPEFSSAAALSTRDDKQSIFDTHLIDTLADRLTVNLLGGSRIISIEMMSNDSRKAARIANIAAETFVEEELKRLDNQETRTMAWLAEKSRTVKFDLLTLEGQALELASKHGIHDMESEASIGLSLDAQKVELTEQLAIAKADGAEIRAQQEGVGPTTADGSTAVNLASMKSPELQELRNVETALLLRLSALEQNLGPRHPEMVSLRQELDATRQQLMVEQERIQWVLRSQIQANSARQVEIAVNVDTVDKAIVNQQMAYIELRDLRRRIDAGKFFLNRVFEEHQKFFEKRAMQQSHVKIISQASTPTTRSYPVIWPSISYIFLGVILFSLVFVFFYERWISDFGFKDLKQIREAGLEPLGVIPTHQVGRGEVRSIASDALANPESSIAEALQKIRERFWYLRPEETNNGTVVMITSSAPREGKTTTAVTLARQTALAGARVLLIDADIRHPNVHHMMGMANGAGLCEILSFELNEEIKFHREASTGLDVLLSGKFRGSSTDLLQSSHMDSLISELRQRYDWIFLDTSALGAVVDSIVLAKHADLIVYMALWLKTTRAALKCDIERLHEVGAKSIGVALNRVDSNASEKYKELFEIKFYGYYHAFFSSDKKFQNC